MFVCQIFLKQSRWLLFLFCWQASKMQITNHLLSFHFEISLSTRRFYFNRFLQSWKLILFHVKAISLQVFTRDMQSKKPCLREFVKEIMTIFVGFVNSNLSASMTTKKNTYSQAFLHILCGTTFWSTRFSSLKRCGHEAPELISNFISNIISK